MEQVKTKGAIKEAFILYVKARRPIWDLRDAGYKNLYLKASLWSEILDYLKGEFELEILASLNMDSIEGIKLLWKNLRSTYQTKRKERKGKSGNGSDDIPKPWIWQDLMSFIGESKDSNLDDLQASSLFLEEPTNYVIAETQADGQVIV